MNSFRTPFGISWRWAREFANSSFARPVALIPVLGYIVLYNKAFSDFFDFTDRLGRDGLFLTSLHKSHCLYFGSILIAAGIAIYIWRCPDECKRHSTGADALEEFTRNGRPHAVIAKSMIWFKLVGPGLIRNDIVNETRDIFLAVLERLSPSQLSIIANVLNEMAARQGVEGIAAGSNIKSISDIVHHLNQKLPSDEEIFLKVLVPAYIRALKMHIADPNIRLLCGDLFTRFFVLAQRLHPKSATLTITLFAVGTFIFVLPTFDVFGQVVVTQFFGLQLGNH